MLIFTRASIADRATHGTEEGQHPDSEPQAVPEVQEEAALRVRRVPARGGLQVWRLQRRHGHDGRQRHAPPPLPHVGILPGAPRLHDLTGNTLHSSDSFTLSSLKNCQD